MARLIVFLYFGLSFWLIFSFLSIYGVFGAIGIYVFGKIAYGDKWLLDKWLKEQWNKK